MLGPNRHSSSAPPASPAVAARRSPAASSRRGLTGRSRRREAEGGTLTSRIPQRVDLGRVTQPPALKAALKRGALLAAANWPLVVVQFIAEGTLNLLLAVPVVGGVFLVVLLLGADVEDVLAG